MSVYLKFRILQICRSGVSGPAWPKKRSRKP